MVRIIILDFFFKKATLYEYKNTYNEYIYGQCEGADDKENGSSDEEDREGETREESDSSDEMSDSEEVEESQPSEAFEKLLMPEIISDNSNRYGESSMSKHTLIIWLLIQGHRLVGFFVKNSAL